MPEMNLRQPVFRYSACGPFTKNEEGIQKFKETGGSRYIYQNELDKSCFRHDMVCGDFKCLNRRTTADKLLRDKVFNIAKYPKYAGYKRGFVSFVHTFFDKQISSSGIKNSSNKELVEELNKPIIRKFYKRKVHSPFFDNMWGAGLADMQLISKFNKGFRFLLCVIDIYSKYEWVIPLKDKKKNYDH